MALYIRRRSMRASKRFNYFTWISMILNRKQEKRGKRKENGDKTLALRSRNEVLAIELSVRVPRNNWERKID
jgi:hypothetical protein